jgi:phage-related protein
VNGLAENLPEMIPAIVEMIMTIVNTLMAPENIALLMDAAIALITGLGQGLINAVPVLIQQLPTLVMNIVRGLITQAVKMNQAGQALVSKLSSSISTAMGGLITQVKTWVQEKIIEPVKEKATSIVKAGKALVEGLWKGIDDKFTWIKNKITEWCGNVVDWFKAKFGVHSPSTVFAGIGENLAEGLAIGWKDGMSAVRNAMSNVPGIDGSIDASPYGMGGSVINIYPQQLDNGTMDYIFARVNSRMGAAI